MNLPISHLVPGMRLARPVYGQRGQMLLNRGIELTSSYISALKERGVLAVTVEAAQDLDLQNAEFVLEETVRLQAMISFQDWVENNRKRDGFTDVVESVSTIVDEILDGKIPLGGLAEISATDTYTFAHSVDVCVLSVFLGINYGLRKNALLALGVGSILHDLGKTRVSPEILNKPGELTAEETEEVNQHPVWGYDMLREDMAGDVSARSLEIVLNHHERLDGSGYPRGLQGGEISDMAGICALSDIYNAMTTERVYRAAFPPNEVYELIMTFGGRYIKYDLVRLFSKCVCPYPVETLVLLSTGQVGCITATNRNLPLRPVVTIVKTRERIDLSGDLSVVIERALTPQEAQAAIAGGR